MRFCAYTRVVALVSLAALAAGCTAVGAMVGSDLSNPGPRQWGHEVPADEAINISRGTPIHVNLPDSTYVRGIWLGLGLPDTTGPSPYSPLARLGVGNQVVIDAQFSSGKLLRSPTRDQIPDTLRIPMDQVEELRAPGGLSEGAKKGAAVGVRLDTLFVITLITALAWMVTALGNLPKQ